MSSYKELTVYQISYELAKELYLQMHRLPKDETFGMISQIKRAATSIPLNIAEGYGKGVSGKELIRFLTMARGSCAEMEVLLNFCKDFGYLEGTEVDEYVQRYTQVGKMLTGLIKSITNNQ